MKSYPLTFGKVYKDYIWGGRNLDKIGKELPADGIVAESWELSCHKNGMSTIANGEYTGMTLEEYIAKFGREVIGTALPEKDVKKFPLLIKFIDANDRLSVQVHPSDEYAFVNENGELGKNEMWYILHAEPNATLVAGVANGVTKESFAEAVKNGTLEECLNYISVKPGDFINIPDGLVHAIGKGIILAEVQQNSDTTYRVYDYNRVGKDGKTRPLHVEKSLDTINFNYTGDVCKSPEGITVEVGQNTKKSVKIANKYFSIEQYVLEDGKVEENADGSKFYVYIICQGEGKIVYNGGELPVKMGRTVLVPANMGTYALEGTMTAIKSYVPDVKKDVVDKLTAAGYSMEEIEAKVAGLNQ